MSQILVELQSFMGDDESIANAAWTSTYDKDRREEKYKDPVKVQNLVRRLANEDHGTPFESVVLRFWMRIPVFLDRQLMTHRIASHNGMSGRYRTMPSDVFTMPQDVYDICVNAGLYTHMSEYEAMTNAANYWYQRQTKALKAARDTDKITPEAYRRAREILRGVLPQANMTERTSIFNLRSFANFQKQRNTDKAQPEARTLAKLMLEEVKRINIAPTAIEALEQKGWNI